VRTGNRTLLISYTNPFEKIRKTYTPPSGENKIRIIADVETAEKVANWKVVARDIGPSVINPS
jgi:hypothetical protein